MSTGNVARSERVTGALLGTFVGDALGMPFEGSDPSRIPEAPEMLAARLGRGTYTDDTEMMISLAEELVAAGAVDPESLARRFLEGHDPRRGYGGGTLRVFALWRQGTPVHRAAKLVFGGQGSLGNGAAMRIAPVGVLFADDDEALRQQAGLSAATTHAHPAGIDAAVVQATAVGAAMRGEDMLAAARSAAQTRELRSRLAEAEELRHGDPSPEQIGALLGNSSAGFESVPAAIFAASRGSDFRSAVGFAVRCGGDTDTIGAMAGAIAGAGGGSGGIPAEWLDQLEDGPRGRSHVERLAAELAERDSRD